LAAYSLLPLLTRWVAGYFKVGSVLKCLASASGRVSGVFGLLLSSPRVRSSIASNGSLIYLVGTWRPLDAWLLSRLLERANDKNVLVRDHASSCSTTGSPWFKDHGSPKKL
jgi:hypothetical protein